MIRFTIYGKPQQKRRHRTAVRGKYAVQYNPEENVEAEATIQAVAMQHRPEQLLDGPLIVEIIAYFPIPKSTSKQKRKDMLAGRIRPTVKPDWDNIGKIYSDALNNIIYPDDKQIVTGITHKLYSETPRVVIDIRKFEPETYGEDHAILPQRRGTIELKPEHTGETLRQLSFLESAVNDQ